MNGKLPITDCDQERLEALLRGDCSQADELELQAHLDRCATCRRGLEERAAEAEMWEEARQMLKSPSETEVPSARARLPVPIQTVLAALAPTDDPNRLGRLGSYEISGVVGAGGMGIVLKAVDPSLDRIVAIKVLAPHLATSGAARLRFAREAKAAAAVLHPNVLAIHSVSNDEALPFFVMPYLRGTSLQKRLEEEGPLPLREALRIGSQIAAGLAAAHAQGLVHRDIKPANILLEEGVERVAITDFGLARAVDDASITHSGVIAGTPQYMSPEQARGEPIDQRSDLFSLGSVLYAICTGRPPFRAETAFGVMRRITDEEPTPLRELNPEIPSWLCEVIRKLMSKRAADRFQSAAEVAELLAACLAHVQQPTVVPLPPALIRPSHQLFPVSQRTGVIAMFGALSLVALAAIIWQGNEAQPNKDPKPAAQQPAADKASDEPLPKRLNYFTTGHSITIAGSADGKWLSVANSNPTRILQVNGTSRVKGDWKSRAEVISAESGKVIVTLKYTTTEEDEVISATERISHVEVTALAFSPVDNVVAVGTSIGQVKLFNARNGEHLRTLDDEKPRLADKDTPENWSKVKRAHGSVSTLVFSPDGTMLVTAGGTYREFSDGFDGIGRLGRSGSVSGPGRVKVWDAKSGALLHDLAGHGGTVNGVAFSPDGNMLATAGSWMDAGGVNYGTGVILWNPKSGKHLRGIQVQANGGTHSVLFSPNSKLVVIGALNFDKDDDTSSTSVTVARAGTGLIEWQRSIKGQGASPKEMLPDGKGIIVLCKQSVQIIDIDTGGLKYEIKATSLSRDGRCYDLTILFPGPRLAVATIDEMEGNVEIWRLGEASAESP